MFVEYLKHFDFESVINLKYQSIYRGVVSRRTLPQTHPQQFFTPIFTRQKCISLAIQLIGIIGLKNPFLKDILNIMSINNLAISRKLVLVALGEFIVQIGEIRNSILR